MLTTYVQNLTEFKASTFCKPENQNCLRMTSTQTLFYSLVLCLFWAATFKTVIIVSCHHMHLTCLIYCCQCAVPVYNIKQHIKWPHISFSVAGIIMSYPQNDLCVVWLRKERKWDRDRLKVGSLRRWVLACLSAVGASRNIYGTQQHCRDVQICSAEALYTFVRKLRWWAVSSA